MFTPKHKNVKSAVKLCSSLALCFSSLSVHADLPSYTEVGAAAGIILQSETNNMGAGIGWIDYNNDGWQDLYVPATAAPNRLYLNNTDGTFTEVGASAGVQLSGKASKAVVVGDYDGDGFDDMFVVNSGINTLLRNQGDGTFQDVTVAAQVGGVSQGANAGAASFGDVDGDGDLDLHVGKWFIITTPVVGCPMAEFFLNNGDGTFTNKTVEAGLADAGCSFDVPMTDYDGDGDLDILEINDTLVGTFPFPQVYRNDGVNSNGVPQFTAVDIGLFSGLFTGMGIAIGDYNNDSQMDYYAPQIGPGVLSTNSGQGFFTTSQLNFDNLTGWGAAFFDADNDGFVDLYRMNCGTGPACGAAVANSFFENNGDGSFALDGADIAGLKHPNPDLGVATADYDNDGDVDIVVHGRLGNVDLFRNDTANGNNWIKLRLTGTAPNHRAIGARVSLVTSNGTGSRTQIREVGAGSGHGSTNGFPVSFGLGDHDQITSLIITWPGGCRQNYGSTQINQISTLAEPECHTISGTVTDSQGSPVAGIQIQINDNSGLGATVGTDASGFYSSLVPNGSYLVLPAINSTYTVGCGWPFVSVAGADVVKDCTATLITYTISGVVADPNGQPVPGALVQVADNFGFSTTVATDSGGAYSVDVTDGTYIVMGVPGQGYVVSCGFAFVGVNGEDVTKDCLASPTGTTISGTVLDENSQPMAGVGIQINDNFGFSATAITNINGFYSQVVSDGTYIVYGLATPTHNISCGFIFVGVSGADVTKDCVGVPL